MNHINDSDASIVIEGWSTLTGAEVVGLLHQKEFQSQWDRLYSTCKWSTVFQSREFFQIFHTVYSDKYFPLLIIYREQGVLKGLLPLSMESSDGRITGAGVNDAHYHAWLCDEDKGDWFITIAIKMLHEKYPKSTVRLDQLPHGIPLKWLDGMDEIGLNYTLTTSKRPLVNLQDPSVFKLPKKKDFKSNRNRLQRIGNFETEEVTNFEAFEETLKVLVVQTDFRKGALYDMYPFLKNPFRAQLYKELFQKRLLYALVLKLNGKIIAGITGMIGKDGWVHGSGINCHSPLFDYYSPGFLSFITLALQLEAQGFKYLDLSTGLLDYKKRIANEYDQVYELLLEPKKTKKTVPKKKATIKERFVTNFWDWVESQPYLPDEPKLVRDKVKILKKNKDYPGILRYFLNGQGLAKASLFSFQYNNNSPSHFPLVSRDELEHLLLYKPIGLNLTKMEFLSSAMEKNQKEKP